MSGDTQAVLATDKVRFQGQEVAAVVATDPYIAEDALELIDVDYEILPAITSPQQSLADGAVLIRDDKEGQTSNLVYEWESGDAAATEAAFAQADRVVSLETFYPRSHPAPLETCGILADVNSVSGQATIYLTSQAPHAHRTVFAMVAGLPEQNIRIISPDIGGGFGNKVPVYPGYVVATAASLVIGKPGEVDREPHREPHLHRLRTRLPHEGRARAHERRAHPRAAGGDALRSGCVLRRRAADAVPRRAVPCRHRQLRLPRRAREDAAARTPTRRRAVSPTGVRSASPRRRSSSSGWCRPRRTSSASIPPRCASRTSSSPSSCPTDTDRLRLRLGRLPHRAPQGARRRGLRRRCAPSRPKRAQGRPAARHRHRALHRGGRRGAVEEVRHPRPEDDRLRRAARPPHRQGDPQARREVAGPGPRDDVRPDRRRRARASPCRTSRCVEGDTDNTPYGLGTYASRSTPVGGAATAMVSRKLARQGEADRRPPARGGRRRHRAGEREVLGEGHVPTGR